MMRNKMYCGCKHEGWCGKLKIETHNTFKMEIFYPMNGFEGKENAACKQAES